MPRRSSNSSRVQTSRAVEFAWTMPAPDQTTTVVDVAAAVVDSETAADAEVAVEAAVASVTAVASADAAADAAVDVVDSVVVVEAAAASRARRSRSRRTFVRPRLRRAAA